MGGRRCRPEAGSGARAVSAEHGVHHFFFLSSSSAAAEHREERVLRNLDVADLFHTRLALLLLLEELALTGDVAAIALGRDVLAQGARWSRGR